MTEEKVNQKEGLREIAETVDKISKSRAEFFDVMSNQAVTPIKPQINLIENMAKDGAQKYITNDLLEEIIKSQPPKKNHYITLVLLILSIVLALWSLFHSYGWV